MVSGQDGLTTHALGSSGWNDDQGIDREVAATYGIATKEVNQAVANAEGR
jgi:hypothetical protein